MSGTARISGGLAVLLAAAIFFPGGCGNEAADKDAEKNVITITLHINEESAKRVTAYQAELLRTFEAEEVGEVTAYRTEGNIMEVTVRIEDLSSINKIKKILIRLNPSAEYRIEHL